MNEPYDVAAGLPDRLAHVDGTLARLAEFWAHPEPDRITGRMPGRIAGSEHDQQVPAGVRNPFWEIVRQMPLCTIGSPWGHSRPEVDGFHLSGRTLTADRHDLCMRFAWSIPSPGDIAWIRDRLAGTGIVEPGAGGGYWAWQLAQAGVDVVAYEPHLTGNNFVTGEPWYPVLRNDHRVTSKHPDRSLLLCWPSYGKPWAGKALKLYAGSQLFYVGEGEGGCCADDAFFRLLDAEWEDVGDCPHHITFTGIRCYLTEYRRKTPSGDSVLEVLV